MRDLRRGRSEPSKVDVRNREFTEREAQHMIDLWRENETGESLHYFIHSFDMFAEEGEAADRLYAQCVHIDPTVEESDHNTSSRKNE